MSLLSLRCSYIDTKNSRKSTIHSYAGKNLSLGTSVPHFVVSTCLRHEVYAFGPLDLPTHTPIQNPSQALERLLWLMCGLESDIIGEQEILFQTERGIRQAFEKGTLPRTHFRRLMDLVTAAESIRKQYSLTSQENYSTIGASLFKKRFGGHPSQRIMVVGAGYMSRIFLKNLELTNTKLIWINRDTKKIRKLHNDILAACASYTLVGIDDLSKHAATVDGIFVAVSNYPRRYKSSTLPLPASPLIVDISYPTVFDGFSDAELFNLNNTNFYHYLQSPPTEETLRMVRHEILNHIDNVINES